jgi:hypothetical protein
VHLHRFALHGANRLLLALCLGLKLQNPGLKSGPLSYRLLPLVKIQLLQFSDLLSEGLQIGLNLNHLLNEVCLPVEVLQLFSELRSLLHVFQS